MQIGILSAIIIITATNSRFLGSGIIATIALFGVSTNEQMAIILGAFVISLVLTVARD